MNAPSKFALIVAGLTIPIAQVANAAAPDPRLWNATWHLDPARSKIASSAKKKSETRTYRISGGKVTMNSTSRDLAGRTLKVSYTAGYDGKWYPMAGNPNADRISLRPVSAREFAWRSQLHGEITIEGTATVSADGKRLTLTRKLLKQNGRPTDVLEFSR